MAQLVVLGLLTAGCGAVPPNATLAKQELSRGNLAAAEAAADRCLARHPTDQTAWRVRILAPMRRADFAMGVTRYAEWHALRGRHDPTALRQMSETVVWQGVTSRAPQIVAQSIRIIERHKVETLADGIYDHLGSDDDYAAATAAVALMTAHPTAPRLATDLLRSDDPKARALVVAGIAEKVGSIARGDLLPMLDDSDASVRRAVVAALGDWAKADDASRLRTLARRDSDPRVRAAAMSALLAFPAAESMETAVAALEDEATGVRMAAVGLLDKSGESSDLLRKLVAGSDISIALRAATALSRKHRSDAHQPLMQRSYQSEDWTVRAASMNTVASIARPEFALSFLRRGLSDPQAEVRLAAARAIIQAGRSNEGTTILRSAVRDPALATELRIQAAVDLARRGEELSLRFLSDSAKSPEHQRAAIAAHQIAGVISDGLIASLGASSIAIRLEAAQVLLDKRLLKN